jgi:hypothetical protein
MPYSNFNLTELLDRFDLELEERQNLFVGITPRVPSDLLLGWLEQNVPLALALSTEKARSEFMIAPILAEVRHLLERRVSLFSGLEFNVDSSQGLNGECDFLFSKSPEQLLLRAPVVTVVEAKNENFKNGIAQAGAEMIAARIFNQRREHPQEQIFGAVTTGDNWQFLKLVQQTLFVDSERYDLDDVPKILGILCQMLEP